MKILLSNPVNGKVINVKTSGEITKELKRQGVFTRSGIDWSIVPIRKTKKDKFNLVLYYTDRNDCPFSFPVHDDCRSINGILIDWYLKYFPESEDKIVK